MQALANHDAVVVEEQITRLLAVVCSMLLRLRAIARRPLYLRHPQTKACTMITPMLIRNQFTDSLNRLRSPLSHDVLKEGHFRSERNWYNSRNNQPPRKNVSLRSLVCLLSETFPPYRGRYQGPGLSKIPGECIPGLEQ